MAMFWTEVPIAIIVVALRMYARFRIKATGLDDWFMVITLVSVPPTLRIRFVDSGPDFIRSCCDSSHLSGSSRRRSSSLLLDRDPS